MSQPVAQRNPSIPRWTVTQPVDNLPLPSSVEDFLWVSSEDPLSRLDSKLAAISGFALWDVIVAQFLYAHFSGSRSLKWMKSVHARLNSQAAVTWIVTSTVPHARLMDWGWAVLHASELCNHPGEFADSFYPVLILMVLSMESNLNIPAVNPDLGDSVLRMLRDAKNGCLTPRNRANTEPYIHIRLAAGSPATTPKLTAADIANALESKADPMQRVALFSLESLEWVPTLPITLLKRDKAISGVYITKSVFDSNDWFGRSILRAFTMETLGDVPNSLPANSRKRLINIVTSDVTLACILRACGHDTGKDDMQDSEERRAAHLRVLVSLAYQLCQEFARLWIRAIFGPVILDIIRSWDDVVVIL